MRRKALHGVLGADDIARLDLDDKRAAHQVRQHLLGRQDREIILRLIAGLEALDR